MAGKASKKFDLGELTRALARDVPESGTEGRDQIEYIDIDLIDSDPSNFYELRDIPDLAGDIETVGLQQPLLVRPGEDGHVVLISGHRRRAALQLLKKIEAHLAPCYKPLWDAGDLPEDTADALAGLPQAVQERIKRVCPKKTPTASNIREIGAKMKTGFCYDVIGLKCPDGGVCTQRDKFLKHNLTCYNWERCSGGKCCVECSAGGAHRVDGSACGAACAEMCAKAREVYEKAKVKKKDSEEREAARARSKAVQKAMADAARIVRAADAAGLDDDTKLESAYSSLTKVGVLRKISQGDIPEDMSDYGLSEIIPYRTKDLTSMAQTLHCSADYLLGLTDQLRPAAAEPGQTVLAAWMPGGLTPPEECEVVADVDPGDGGKPVRSFLRWLGGAWMFKNLDKKIDMTVLRWLRLPEVEKEESDNGD